MQIFAIVVSLAIAAVGIALFVKAIRSIIATVKIGQPAVGRTDDKAARWTNMLKETLGHTRMLQWTAMGVGHWFVFIGFGLLFFTLLTAFGQLFDPHFALPLIGHFFLYEWVSELFTVGMLIAIVAFIGYRVTRPKERTRGTKGRFYGSTMWQAYFVESVILGVGLCIAVLRGAEYAISQYGGETANALHYPFSFWIGELFSGLSESALANLIYLVAMIKIVISFTWMIVISRNTTMGVAWHRFTAFFNIWFKRRSDGGTALGGLQPIMVNGAPIDFENIEDLDEDAPLGIGRIEDFAWKGILDFTSCTECGRCQSQCPAWNTEKPLSPKLFITNLRDHAYAKAPYLLADEADRDALPDHVKAAAERELVGATEGDPTLPSGGAVIDPEVLWNCTSCGACVQQCPVDIEHVDHIMDMRRYQVLVESNFPSELNGLFKGLENKGNPWNMSPNARMDWAKDLDFEVKQVGTDVEDLDEVDWLFWVGCAGAYEDRAKKTTRAVAELLDLAGVSFAVLGNGETCTGDPARRVRQRVRLPAARDAERGGVQGGQGQEGRLHLRALLQHPEERVRRVRRRARGRAPHPAAQPPGARGQADPGRRRAERRQEVDHLPRPVLPRPAQPGLLPAPRAARRASPTPSWRRCRATASGPSAAAPAAPACGWRRRPASGST